MKLLALLLCLTVRLSAQPFIIGADPVFQTASSGVVYTNVTAGLVGWWKMDDNSGTSATDSSGNSLTATLNTAAIWTNGLMGSAMLCSNYTTAGFGFVTDAAPLDTCAYGITVAFWLYLLGGPTNTATTHAFYFVCKSCTTTGPNAFTSPYYVNLDGFGNINWKVGCTNNAVSAAASPSPPTNIWYHIACMADGSNIKIYTNGIISKSVAQSASDVLTNNLKIGFNALYQGASVVEHEGNYVMDDIRIYNRALTAGEMTQLYGWRP